MSREDEPPRSRPAQMGVLNEAAVASWERLFRELRTIGSARFIFDRTSGLAWIFFKRSATRGFQSASAAGLIRRDRWTVRGRT